MITHTETLTLECEGKGTYEITSMVEEEIKSSGVREGMCTVFLQHTSASLMIYENADPTARQDLDRFFEELVPDDGDYIHDSEGADDSTSHLRMALTRTSESIPINEARLCLGTWQGIFLFEHRHAPHQRRVIVSVIGN